MSFRKVLFSIFIALSFSKTYTQINLKLIDSINFTEKQFDSFVGVDIHDNFFFKKENTLIKINNSQIWEYANLELGQITSISILNPLQILIFYKNTNSIVLLDHFLSETKTINLNNLQKPMVAEWVENAKNQEVWIYNNLNNQLELFNYQNSNSISASIPLPKTPSSLAANFNTAFILLNNSIKSYNNYGTLLKNETIDSIQKIQLHQNNLIAITEDKYILLDKNLKPTLSLKKPKNSDKDFSISNEKLYIYRESKLYKYKVELPLK